MGVVSVVLLSNACGNFAYSHHDVMISGPLIRLDDLRLTWHEVAQIVLAAMLPRCPFGAGNLAGCFWKYLQTMY